MSDQVETVKAILGLKSDQELARLFPREKSLRTIRLWKKEGLPASARLHLNGIAHQHGRSLPSEWFVERQVGVSAAQQPDEAA